MSQFLLWEVSLGCASVSPLVAPLGDNVPPSTAWPWPLRAGRRQACGSRSADIHLCLLAGETCSLAHSGWIHILPSGMPEPGNQRNMRLFQIGFIKEPNTPMKYNGKGLLSFNKPTHFYSISWFLIIPI